MEITRQNITDADLDFLNIIKNSVGCTHGWEIYKCTETITTLLREELFKTALFNEMYDFKKGYLEEGKEVHLDVIFDKIDSGAEAELSSNYINHIMYNCEVINELLNNISRYLLEKKYA
ncbi:hypothetical protein M2T70_04810 [Elizabethkingia anophelis]|uniref:hypothetical protein n=1 Tax=Elizabethkingia anophelis TaxID=1117645 RepID=UPI000BA84EF7|nr:hypothetical protein [Elizabethkingia anophelis]ASV77947.1 hypothetical protein A6J37_04555 [Elizabethkingia anophelis]MCL1648265.1 hypothetical protein [Elizabethkingia anophelis]MCL1683659.1 hypothetical protein [Elizabethkingia anophelis]MDV3460766.1 hypothetical protein [Elizabethkingia anophelis]MDV3571637.1 hypothetical protein [Elizabethkingia anophelis]